MKKIFLFYFLSLIGFRNIQAQSCLPDLTFTGPYTVTYTKSATWIKSSGITTIPTGANVTWDGNPLAGVNGYVELNPGFETQPGSEFLGIVQAICVENPLPVTLLYFNAKPVGVEVQLNWVTTIETNSAGYDIERSENSKEFTNIGFVQSAATDGTINEKLNYKFSDNAPSGGWGAGLYFYRLKQLDLDGKFSYSAIKSVKMESENFVNVYPNPTSDYIMLDVQDWAKIKNAALFNATGKLLMNVLHQKRIDVQNLPAGIYFMNIEDDKGKITVKKILKN